MKKHLIFIICLFLTVSVGGKDRFNERVARYYQHRNNAELQIMDSAYKEALASYKKAFTFKYPNARDLYNAFAVAYLTGDSADARRFIVEIFLNGQAKEKIAQGRFIATVKDEPFYAWLTSGYDSIRTVAGHSEKKQIAARYDLIIDNDQKARTDHPHPTGDEARKLISNDSLNVDKMIGLFSTAGFPSYERVGLFENITQGYVAGDNSVWLLLWHVRNSNLLLNAPVTAAVMKGEYPPDEFSLIMDMQVDSSVYYSVLPRRKDAKGEFIFEKLPDTKAINARRAALYLEPIEDYKRKLDFQKNVDRRFYMSTVWADILNYAPMDFKQWNKGE